MKFKSLQHHKQISYNKRKTKVMELGLQKKWKKVEVLSTRGDG